MSETKSASSELELDGHIFLVERDNDGNVTKRSELNPEICLKVIVAVLDDAIKNPILDTIVDFGKSVEEDTLDK